MQMSKRQVTLSQISYIDKMLSRYFKEDSKKGMLLFIYRVHISKEQSLKTLHEIEDMRYYTSVMGRLIYVIFCTRSDICYAVGMVNNFQSKPRLDYYTVIKNILKYLRIMMNYMLVFLGTDLKMTEYIDSNFQADKEFKKSILL